LDTLSHGIAGAVLARPAAGRGGARAALLLGFVTAMLPDLDFLWAGDRIGYLRTHRGWTHSFVLMPLVSLGLALLARAVWRDTALRRLWLLCAIGQASHIAFDWMTSYGTMLLIPFTRHRYSLDWVFILDPFFTGIPAVALVLAGIYRQRARAIALAGSAALLAYIGACGLLHARALEIWVALDRPPAGRRVAVVPQFLSPFRWLGLSEHEGELHAAFFDIGPFARGLPNPKPPDRILDVLKVLPDFYPPPGHLVTRRFPSAPDSPVREEARSLPSVRIYREFARFPLETVTRQADGSSVYSIQDLRFLPFFAGPWGRDETGRLGRQPFVYRMQFDAEGRVLEQGFVRGGASREK
jgi:inner membrane protein